MRTLTALGLLTLLSGCLNSGVDDAAGLAALRPTLGALGQEVVRIDDAALTGAYRDHAATWQAAIGD